MDYNCNVGFQTLYLLFYCYELVDNKYVQLKKYKKVIRM